MLNDIILNLIEKQQKEISLLKDQLEYVKSEYEETIEHQQKEIEDWKFTAKYVEENYISKDKIKPIQIIDLDGKIHNIYKIEEE